MARSITCTLLTLFTNWIPLIAVVVLAYSLNRLEPTTRQFLLSNPEISYPLMQSRVPNSMLITLCTIVPGLLLIGYAALEVYIPIQKWSTARVFKRAERRCYHLGIALSTTMFFTDMIKLFAGRTRTYLLARRGITQELREAGGWPPADMCSG